MKTYEERMKIFNEGVAQLIKDTEIEPIPTIAIGTGGIAPQITLVDLNNPDMLNKYGLVRVKRADEVTPEKPEPPENPLAN